MSILRIVKDCFNTNYLLRNLVQPVRVARRRLNEMHWKEKKISYGARNADKTFYVIRRTDRNCGLFSYFITVLGNLKIAEERNFIPIVDMQNYANSYLEESEIGKINSWEFFFKQVSDYSLTEVYESKNVVLSDGGIPTDIPAGTVESLLNIDGIIDEWRYLCKKYIYYDDEVFINMKSEYESLFEATDRVLGIICRGTDYTKYKPVGHWRQPDVDIVIAKAKEICELQCCNKIFLATEDYEIYLKFQRVFGKQLLINKKHWIHYDGKQGINNYFSGEAGGRKGQGLQYLTTIYMLSRCNCITGGRAGGTVGAVVLSDGYEFAHFWDWGVYSLIDK